MGPLHIVLIIHADRPLRSAFEISLRRFSNNASLKMYSNVSKARLLSSLSNAVRLRTSLDRVGTRIIRRRDLGLADHRVAGNRGICILAWGEDRSIALTISKGTPHYCDQWHSLEDSNDVRKGPGRSIRNSTCCQTKRIRTSTQLLEDGSRVRILAMP